jgi:hypothetical protein
MDMMKEMQPISEVWFLLKTGAVCKDEHSE